MRKKLFPVITVALLLVIMSGCGIAQEEYDSAEGEMEQTKAHAADMLLQIQNMETRITDITANISTCESDCASLEQELADIEEQNGNLRTYIADTLRQLEEKTQSAAEINNENAALKGRLSIPEYALYEDADSGYSVNYPGSWSFQTVEEQGVVRHVFKDAVTGATMSISGTNSGGLTTREFYESAMDAIAGEYGNRFLFIGETPVLMGGQLGIQAAYTVMENGSYKTACITNFIVANDTVWEVVLTCGWDRFSGMAFTFIEMIHSFTIS